MSGIVKYSKKDNQSIYADVLIAVEKIKTLFKEQSKNNTQEVFVGLSVCGHGAHPFGAAALPSDYIDFRIEIGKALFVDYGERDVTSFFNALRKALNELRGDSRYKTLQFTEETIYPYCGSNNCEFNVIKSVYMITNLPKEFNTLNKFINKHTSKNIDPYKWYRVNLFGKRDIYDESGDKSLLCFDEDRCERILTELKKRKGNKDKMTCNIVTIDNIDTEYSRRYETECYGTRYQALHITIATPTGKIKLDAKY